jgi:hypothetical protein
VPGAPNPYASIATIGPVADHPPPLHADHNIKLRGWEPCTTVGCGSTGGVIGFVKIPPDPYGPDPKAPKLHTLFSTAGAPFAANFRVYDWNWGCGQHGCKGQLSTTWDVQLVTFSTAVDDVLKLPASGYQIAGSGHQARALYVDGDSVTLKYTGEDSVAVGYALTLIGICPEPGLRARYDANDAAGRSELPALKAGEPIGRACGSSVLVAIRDSGTFMDPRSETDWWQGHP